MAFGQKQNFVASFQPGTTNTPFPRTVNTYGGFLGSILGAFGATSVIPPFVAVRCTLTNDWHLSIAASTQQTVANIQLFVNNIIGFPGVPGTLTAIEADLANVNITLTRIADQKKIFADFLTDLNIYLAAATTAQVNKNVIAVNAAQSIIQANNFYQMTSGDNPELGNIQEQLEKAVKEGFSLFQQSSTAGTFNNFLTKTITNITEWIEGTAVYQTISGYLSKIKDTILSIELPSKESIKSRASSQGGVKDL